MNKAILFIIFSLLITSALDAQVRRKYRDKEYTNHTVVIKETKQVSDLDILNTEFDIDQFEMGQVVKITTESRQLSSVETLDKAYSSKHKINPSAFTTTTKRNLRSRKFKNKHYSFSKRKKSRRRVGKNKKSCFTF